MLVARAHGNDHMARTVVQFVGSDTFGGCEEVILMLLAGLDRSRWRPVLFHYDAPGLARLWEEATQLGIECRRVPRLERGTLTAGMKQFVHELRDVSPAIFHAHLNWPLASRHEIMAARITRTPVVATCHLYTPISGLRSRLKQHIHAACIDRYIAVSNEVKKRLCLDLHVAGAKVTVVQNGTRLPAVVQPVDEALRASLTGDPARPLVFTAARLHSQKGHTYLLEAAALVPDAVFVLAGDGPERAALEERARALGVDGRVRFLGQRRDVPTLLASCDVFVLPSLYEGLPLTVLEALGAGKPLVATAIAGTDENRRRRRHRAACTTGQPSGARCGNPSAACGSGACRSPGGSRSSQHRGAFLLGDHGPRRECGLRRGPGSEAPRLAGRFETGSRSRLRRTARAAM